MKELLLLSVALVGLILNTNAQDNQWVNYTNGDYITSIVEDGDDMWVGTSGGLVNINKSTGNKTVYNKTNSGLPNIWITDIAIDGEGTKWFLSETTVETGYRLTSYDGSIWTTYNPYESGLEIWQILSFCEHNGEFWMGTREHGVIHFDGISWEVFNYSNTGIDMQYIKSLIFDNNGTLWIVSDGLFSYNGTDWVEYDTTNSSFHGGEISSMAIGSDGTVWIGSNFYGITSFDGTNWVTYDTTNSNIPFNLIRFIAIDNDGYLWILGREADHSPQLLVQYTGTDWISHQTAQNG